MNDAENHQKQVKDASDNVVGDYLYDGDGRRVKKISSTETTVFVYDGGGQLVAEYSTQISQTPQVSYLTTDHLGSPRVTTDQLGAVTARKDYSAFGEETLTSQRQSALGYAATSADEQRKGYTGYEKDNESGLDFAQARYYNSTHGRYTSVDPLTASASIRNPQTFNRYSYVLNSPYKFTDPLGLLPASANSWGGCGAEFSSCDGNSGGFANEFERQYQERLENDYARMRAQAAANRGDWDTFWDIMRGNDTLSAYDQNGERVRDPNEPTVTVKATVNVSSAGAESGSTINLSIADSGYNSREINQYILNLFGINSEPDDGVVVTEPIRELIADLRKTARGLYRLVFSNLESDAMNDGIFQSTVERTNARAVSITASRIVGEYLNKTFKATLNGQSVTYSYTREFLRSGVTAVLLRARVQAEEAFAKRYYPSRGYNLGE